MKWLVDIGVQFEDDSSVVYCPIVAQVLVEAESIQLARDKAYLAAREQDYGKLGDIFVRGVSCMDIAQIDLTLTK
jgi:hypothetical protein